jgi:hypothetical protein
MTSILASIDFGNGKVHIVKANATGKHNANEPDPAYIVFSYKDFLEGKYLQVLGTDGVVLLEHSHSMPTSTSWSMSQPYTLDQWNEIVSKLAECNVQILLFSQYLTPKNRKLYGTAKKTSDYNDAYSNLKHFQANPEQLNQCRVLGVRHKGQFKTDELRAEVVNTLNESIRKAMFYGYKQEDAITRLPEGVFEELDEFRNSSPEMKRFFGSEELDIKKRYFLLLCCLVNPVTGELWGFDWKYVKRFLLGCTQWRYKSGILASEYKGYWRTSVSRLNLKDKSINTVRTADNAEDFRLAMREVDALMSKAFQYVRDNILKSYLPI